MMATDAPITPRWVEALDQPRPHGFLIWKGKQRAVVDVRLLPIAQPVLITTGDEAFGLATFSQPAQIRAAECDKQDWVDQHCTYPAERRQRWPTERNFYIYRLSDWQPFKRPQLYADGQLIEDVPTPQEMGLMADARFLPKQIILDPEAVIFSAGCFNFAPGVPTEELRAILKATYGREPRLNGAGNGRYLALYQLALVRVPHQTFKDRKR